jgi:23S rRNA (cytosine1962-C5)-methyltransferase
LTDDAAVAFEDDYALIDAGDGRRLEGFGARTLDRPAPSATWRRRLPSAWERADLRFERGRGWTETAEPWAIRWHGLTLEMRLTPAGQVGLFPEHAVLWPWFHDVLWDRRGAEILNLFAYTGATTLALAREGARVAHVDASRPAVGWARRNAALSGLTDAPIRWLVDDAAVFVAREVRRGRRYHGVVLDPPSYGHASGGRRAWRLDAGLADLLDRVAALVEPGGFVLLTSHSTGWDAERLADALAATFVAEEITTGDLELPAVSGAVLRLGSFGRVIIAP